MSTEDEALTLSNPRLLSAAYFGLLAILATMILNLILYLLGIEQIIPIGESIALAAFVAACFGALFGERIVHSRAPYAKTVFFWAFLMVLVAMPVYNVWLIALLRMHYPANFLNASLSHSLRLYGDSLLYGFVFIGFWYALIAGLAAVYLRGHLVYYLTHSLYRRRMPPEKSTGSSSSATSFDETANREEHGHDEHKP